VKPGAGGYGILRCAGFLTHNPANQLQIEINGTTPGVSCDQLHASGSVSLLGGTLQVAMNFTGAVSNEYVIVKNDSPYAVSGSFGGLPQNGILMANGVAFQINYQGGDGNDIVLIQRSLAGVGPQLTEVLKHADGSIEVGGAGIPNASYKVDATASLSPPVTWIELDSVTADAAGQLRFNDPDAPNHVVRFYRFRQE
jgi:hypothetical protein